jgi:hypothetical protein
MADNSKIECSSKSTTGFVAPYPRREILLNKDIVSVPLLIGQDPSSKSVGPLQEQLRVSRDGKRLTFTKTTIGPDGRKTRQLWYYERVL